MEPYYHPDACQDCPSPAASAEVCQGCPARVVCRCLQATEATLLKAITTLELRTVKELRLHTGAGDGCTCCHALLGRYLQRHAYASSSSSEPICSCK